MANLKDVIYISNEDYETLVSTGTVTIDGTTLTYDENNVYVTPDKLASSTEDGMMSSADKSKLDTITGVTNTVTSGSTDVVTSGGVYSAIDALPKPMLYKGTLGTGGTITDLPTASSTNEGFTYKVITDGTYASQSAKVGDVFISNGSVWTLVPAGDDVEDTWRNIKVNDTELLGTAISTGYVNFKNNTNAISLTASGNDIGIGLTDAYGDIKNPYSSKSARYALMAPAGGSGVPSFRNITGADIVGGGINSLINSNSAVGINPAINGLGNAVDKGTTVEIFYDDFKINVTSDNAKRFFDGINSTEVRVLIPSTCGNPVYSGTEYTNDFVWDSSITYAQGDLVCNSSDSSVKYWWRSKISSNTNNTLPSSGTSNDYWEDVSGTDSYHNGLDGQKFTYVSIVCKLHTSVEYENGLTIYWRTSGQHPNYITVEKLNNDYSVYGTVVENKDIRGETASTVYLGTVGGGANVHSWIRIKCSGMPQNTYWAFCPTQLAFTGIIGGLEGAVVMRCGGRDYASMFGDFMPYTSGGASLGDATHKWNNIYLSGAVKVDTLQNSSGSTYIQLRSNDINLTKDVIANSGTNSLGTSTYPWKDLHLSGRDYFYNASNYKWSLGVTGDGLFQIFGNDNATKYSFWNSYFTPGNNETQDLGTSSLKWRDLYLSGNLSDGTNSVSIANIASKDYIKEMNVQWGGPAKSGQIGPIAMGISAEHGANRLAFVNGNAITCEYSSDGGSTWTNYEYSANEKSSICTMQKNVPVGRPDATTEIVANMSKTRITLTGQDGSHDYFYTSAKKLLVRVSTAKALSMLVEIRTGANYLSDGDWTTVGTYTVNGWSGWNDIPFMYTVGGYSGQTGNNWQMRLTFTTPEVDSSYPKQADILSIRLFGDNAYVTPSYMADVGHLYGYNINKKAFFPGEVQSIKHLEVKSNNGSYIFRINMQDNGNPEVVLNGTSLYYLTNYAFFPASTSFSLGSNSYKWGDIYSVGALRLKNASASIEWSITGSSSDLLEINRAGNNRLRVGNSYFAPGADNSISLGLSNLRFSNIYLGGSLRDGNNANYGLILPDTTSYTANKTIATSDQLVEIVDYRS